MPVIKTRPNIPKLLRIAVKKNDELKKTTNEILERPAYIWFKHSYSTSEKSPEGKGDNDSDSDSDDENKPTILNRFISSVHDSVNKLSCFTHYIPSNVQQNTYEMYIKSSRWTKIVQSYSGFSIARFILACCASALIAYEVTRTCDFFVMLFISLTPQFIHVEQFHFFICNDRYQIKNYAMICTNGPSSVVLILQLISCSLSSRYLC